MSALNSMQSRGGLNTKENEGQKMRYDLRIAYLLDISKTKEIERF